MFVPVFNSTLYSYVFTLYARNREKHGWLGDAQVTAEEAMQNFDMVSVYEEFLVSSSQWCEGHLPVWFFGSGLTVCPLDRT